MSDSAAVAAASLFDIESLLEGVLWNYFAYVKSFSDVRSTGFEQITVLLSLLKDFT